MNAKVFETKQILECFLNLPATNWVIKPALPPLERDALYSVQLEVFDRTYKHKEIIEYEILIAPKDFLEGKTVKHISLNYAFCVDVRSGLPSFMSTMLHEWDVKLSEPDLGRAEWPVTDDPLLKKVEQIARAARLPSQGSSALN